MSRISRKDLFNYASTDTKPTDVPAHSVCIESDTGDMYELDGTTWRQTGTGGAAHTNQQGGIWDYGTWPENAYLPASVVLPASASGTVVFTSTDVTGYNGLVMEVAAIGGTTPVLKLTVSINGTDYAATLPEWINLADNTVIAGATGISAIGLYALNTPAAAKVKYKAMKLTQTGGAANQTCTVRYAHLWA